MKIKFCLINYFLSQQQLEGLWVHMKCTLIGVGGVLPETQHVWSYSALYVSSADCKESQ